MIGLDYSQKARYVVTVNGTTVARFNSLAKAKGVVHGLTNWKIFFDMSVITVDGDVYSVIADNDTAERFAWFIERSDKFPQMARSAKLFDRYKKSKIG